MPSITLRPLKERLEDSANNWIKRNQCPETGSGVHEWIKSAAGSLKKIGLAIDKAHEIIDAEIPTDREPQPKEISDILRFVYGRNSVAKKKETVPAYNVDELDKAASRVPIEITNDWLAEQSPECVYGLSPTDFLDAVFNDGEQIFCATTCKPYEQPGYEMLYKVRDKRNSKSINRVMGERNTNGAWYVLNPVDDSCRRANANVVDFRHILLESDKDGIRDLWLRMIVQLAVPIVALYESGNVSVHALIRIDAKDEAEFDSIHDRYIREMCPLGACDGSLTASRLTRLPNIVRADNGRMQRLLYLAPEATNEPIYKRMAAPGRRDPMQPSTK
jgi:hypothetical protein